MDIVIGIIKESYFLLNKMSPYLLFGFLFAGILHIFVNTETVAKHLGKSSILSVIKASLFGIPLPLCSCGVIPAAASLRKEGASKGAILAFLISTPTSGVDSILVTFSLMGGFFAAYRVAASFIAGVFSGILANVFLGEETLPVKEEEKGCKLCHDDDHKDHHEVHDHTFMHKIKGMFTYAFRDLLMDIGEWLLVGIIVGGAIAYFLPQEFISTYLGSGWKAMVIMLIIGMPMYVCATGSIPIAAALMLKGMNPGAAFVFLLAGPATNAIGMTVVSKQLGKKALIIYLASIAISSILLGLLLDKLWGIFQTKDIKVVMEHAMFMPQWIEKAASSILVLLVGYNFVNKVMKKRLSSDKK